MLRAGLIGFPSSGKTALFNPRKHVPATVEFADIAGVGGVKTGAAALLDVAPFRNADALLHVVRMFRDPAVPHPSGTIDPARDVRTMEDEVILADLGVVERRLERLTRVGPSYRVGVVVMGSPQLGCGGRSGR